MLILSRRVGETLVIDDDITLTVLSVSGNQVRYGIVAPKEVTVDREEVWLRKQTEQKKLGEPRKVKRWPNVSNPCVTRPK